MIAAARREADGDPLVHDLAAELAAALLALLPAPSVAEVGAGADPAAASSRDPVGVAGADGIPDLGLLRVVDGAAADVLDRLAADARIIVAPFRADDAVAAARWRSAMARQRSLGYATQVLVCRGHGAECVHVDVDGPAIGEAGALFLVHRSVPTAAAIAAAHRVASRAARRTSRARPAGDAARDADPARLRQLERMASLAHRLDLELDRMLGGAASPDPVPASLGDDAPMPALPRITVVTAVRNGEAHLRAAMESVLAQEYPDLEYIVVDGGSTDATPAIIDEYRERLALVISEPDEGLYDALAKGFEACTGEVLCYLNADDRFEPGALRRIGRRFAERPELMAAYHENTVDVGGWRFPGCPQPSVSFLYLLKGHILPQEGVFFRRRAYRAIGGIDRRMRLAGDWDLWTRMASRFPFERLESHASCFRVRAGQLSEDVGAYHREVEQSRLRITGGRSAWTWSRLARLVAARARNVVRKATRPRRLYFPWPGCRDLPEPRPDAASAVAVARCPLCGAPPQRLLLPRWDARTDRRVRLVYHHPECGMAAVWPPPALGPAAAARLRDGAASELAPPAGKDSPYAGYRGGGLLGRAQAKLLPRVRPPGGPGWEDASFRRVRRLVRRRQGSLLALGEGMGGLLRDARAAGWSTAAVHPHGSGIDGAGEAWAASPEEAAYAVPVDRRFDVVVLADALATTVDPAGLLARAATLLAPGGRLVAITPNLDSRQLDFFGPTWAHWHAAGARWIWSPAGLRAAATAAGLRLHRCATGSHPRWTCTSRRQNALGIAGSPASAPDAVGEDADRARALTAWSRWLWDWRGRGDACYASFGVE